MQALFGILLFLTKHPRHLSFYFLIIWFGLIAIFLGASLLPFQVVEYYKPGIFPILFLFGPLLYLYLSSLTIENFKLKPVTLLHLVPFLGVSIHRSMVSVVSITSSSNLSENPYYIYNKIYYSLFIISLLIYWFLKFKACFEAQEKYPLQFFELYHKKYIKLVDICFVTFPDFFCC